MEVSSFLEISNSFSIFLSNSKLFLRIASFFLMTGEYQRTIPKTAAARSRRTMTRVSLSQMLRLVFNGGSKSRLLKKRKRENHFVMRFHSSSLPSGENV